MKSHLTIVVKLHIIQSKKFIVHTKQSCIYWNECDIRIGLWNGFDTVCLNKNAELVFMREGIECVWLAGEWKSMLGDKKMRNKANHIVSYRIVSYSNQIGALVIMIIALQIARRSLLVQVFTACIHRHSTAWFSLFFFSFNAIFNAIVACLHAV